MSWTCRWRLLGCIALAQLGTLIVYHAILNDGPTRASAAVPAIEEKQQKPSNPEVVLPPIPVPILVLPPAMGAPLPLPESAQDARPLTEIETVTNPIKATVPQTNEAILSVVSKEVMSEQLVAPVCPWNLQIEIIEGRTQLTAQCGKETKLVVSCEKLDMQSPHGAIRASAKVRLESDCIKGTCEQLTISWENDAIVFEKAELKCKLEGQEAELRAEELTLRLSRTVLVGKPFPPPDGDNP